MLYAGGRPKPTLDAFTDEATKDDRVAIRAGVDELVATLLAQECSGGRQRFIRVGYQYVIDTDAVAEPTFVVVVAREDFPVRRCWHMIEDIRKVPQARASNACLLKEIEFFNSNPNADKLLAVQAEIDATKGIMMQNMEKVFDRQERMDDLMEASDRLLDQSIIIQRTSFKVADKQKWKACKWTVCCIVVALCVFVFLGGGTFLIFFFDVIGKLWPSGDGSTATPNATASPY